MGAFASIVGSGVASVLRHPLRSAVTVACVVSVVVPYVAGLAVSRGLLDDAEDSAALGPDLVVRGERFGRAAPLPLSTVDVVARALADVPGVEVAPRVVGEVALGRDRIPAVLVGVPRDRLPPSTECIEGEWFRAGGAIELVVGRALAQRLGLRVGSTIPPFYENERGQRVASVVGVFRAGAPVWESRVVLTSVEAAQWVFAQEGLVTEVQVRCPPSYREEARRAVRAIRELAPAADGASTAPLRPSISTREEVVALLSEGLVHREGVLGIHLLLAFAVGIPLVLVTSGIGLSERRREIGLLKALGWQTDEVLLRGAAESLVIALLGASLSILLAWVWLSPLHGRFLAGLFLDAAGGGVDASLPVPFRLTPVPALLATIASLAVVLLGTLVSTWRTASAAPAEALR